MENTEPLFLHVQTRAFVSVCVCTGEQRSNMVNIELTILSVDGQTEIQDMMYKLLNK